MKITAVATFAHPEHHGGAERVISEVCARLAAREHSVRLVTGAADGVADDEQRDGVTIARYPLDRSSTPAFWRSVRRGVLARLAEEPAPDVLHVHQIASALPAIDAGLACPVVGSFYAPYSEEFLARRRDGRDTGSVDWKARATAALLRRFDRRVLSGCARLVVLSDFSAAQVAALSPAARARTVVAPAGIDLERFSPGTIGSDAMRARLGAPSRATPLVLSVRRLEPRMGLIDLLDAAAILRDRGVELHVAIVGEGPARENLEARAARDDLRDRVTLAGRVEDDDLPDVYRAADVFVLPTRSLEGFGISTGEALASGLPIVATNVGATPDVLAGVTAAALVPPERPDLIANALEPLLRNEVARRAASDMSRAHALATLSWTRHITALDTCFREAVAEAAR